MTKSTSAVFLFAQMGLEVDGKVALHDGGGYSTYANGGAVHHDWQGNAVSASFPEEEPNTEDMPRCAGCGAFLYQDTELCGVCRECFQEDQDSAPAPRGWAFV